MRQLPQVHKRFFRLKFGEKFEINGVVYQKETFLSAVRCLGYRLLCDTPHAPFTLMFWPWTKVRTCELVRDARPGGKSSYNTPEKFDANQHICFSDKPHTDDGRTGPSA